MIELVVGVAVFCDNKQTFIGKIFELTPESQTVLKSMVQHVMEAAVDIEEGGEEEDGEVEEEEHNRALVSSWVHVETEHGTDNVSTHATGANVEELIR